MNVLPPKLSHICTHKLKIWANFTRNHFLRIRRWKGGIKGDHPPSLQTGTIRLRKKTKKYLEDMKLFLSFLLLLPAMSWAGWQVTRSMIIQSTYPAKKCWKTASTIHNSWIRFQVDFWNFIFQKFKRYNKNKTIPFCDANNTITRMSPTTCFPFQDDMIHAFFL